MERFGLTRSLVLLISVLVGTPGGARPADSEVLRVRQLRPVQLDPASVGMADCQSAGELDGGTILAVCRAPRVKGSPGELHLMLIERSASGTKVLYRGPGAGDSYYVRPTVLGGGNGDSMVVLAEAGAEFSYGIEVYVIEPDRKVLKAGFLDVSVDAEDGTSSAVPFAQVERSGSGLCIRFTRDVQLQRGRSYVTVPKGKAVYKYKKGRKLVPVKSCPAATGK